VRFVLRPSIPSYFHSRVSQIWGVSLITIAGIVTVAGSPSLLGVAIFCTLAYIGVRHVWERLYVSHEEIVWRKIGWSTNHVRFSTAKVGGVELRTVDHYTAISRRELVMRNREGEVIGRITADYWVEDQLRGGFQACGVPVVGDWEKVSVRDVPVRR
jgi:hypothetical protein